MSDLITLLIDGASVIPWFVCSRCGEKIDDLHMGYIMLTKDGTVAVQCKKNCGGYNPPGYIGWMDLSALMERLVENSGVKSVTVRPPKHSDFIVGDLSGSTWKMKDGRCYD